MAVRSRKGQTRVIVETPENEPENEPETEAEGAAVDAERQADDVLGSVPLRTTVKLWRRDRSGREAYLDAIDAAALGGGDVNAGLPAYVKDHYGGGEYRFEIRGPVGKGRLKGYRGGDSFTIDRAIPSRYPHDAEAEEPARAPVVPTTANGSMAEMLQSTVLTLVMDLVRQGQESAKLQNELTRASIEQLRTNMNPAREERDPLEMFKTIADLLKPAQQAASPLGQLKELLELRELLDGGKGEPSALGVVADLAPQLLGTINKALDQRKPGEQPATIHDPDGTVVARAPAPAPAPAVPAGQPQPEGAAVLQLLGGWVPRLAKWAEQDRAPEWVAETLLYEIPAGYHAVLKTAIEPDNAVAQIAAGFPAIAPFTDWLAQVRAELLASLNAEDSGDAPDDPSG
jgi:hypothetical protein